MANEVNIRQIVMEMLLEMSKGQMYSHLFIRDVQNKYDYLSVQEKSFLKRLFEGTVERMIELDYVINQFSNVKVNKMKPVIRSIMRLSVYQILYMDSVPDSAACNEAVKLAQSKKFATLKGFVNGVLRNIARNKENIKYPDKETEFLSYLSVTYSMPEWMIQMWLEQYSNDQVELLLQGLLEEHPVTIRILKKETWEQIFSEMKQNGIEAKKHPYCEDAFCLSGNLESMADLPGFSEGDVTVQDVSSMLAVKCAGIQSGDYVMDVCAAPGGKTMFASKFVKETGKVLARDVSERKVELIKENLERAGIINVTAQVWDATVLDEENIGKADVVLADVPCSGLGVMGKKRDIKYHVTKESLQEIVKLQKQIMEKVTAYVKPGGTLLYSTCTIHQKENEEMVQWIEKNFPFTLVSLKENMPEELKKEETLEKGYLQLLPGIHQSDGFFIAKFKKDEN